MKEFVCVVCPKGCRLHVDEDNAYSVTGNSCEKGEVYGRQEASAPTRVITSTVAVENGLYRRCPVKISAPISKELIFEAMRTLDGIFLRAPVRQGQLVVENVCGTGADFITERAMKEGDRE